MLDKIKIGLLDLLTILVPGGFVLLLLGNVMIDTVKDLWEQFPQLTNEWVVPVVAAALAYIFGHFVFFFASFLDELIYEKVRRVYWHEHNKLSAYVVQMKKAKTGITDRKVMNAWKWSCTWLISNQQEIYAEVERHIAESKFFRSLVIVLLVAAVVFFTRSAGWQTLSVIFLLAFFSLVRYMTQRQRSLEVAYHGMITSSNQVHGSEPDPEIYAQIQENLLYPNEKLHAIVKHNSANGKRGFRPDQVLYNILKFFYTIGLCLIPGFSAIVRSKQSRERIKKARLQHKSPGDVFTLS